MGVREGIEQVNIEPFCTADRHFSVEANGFAWLGLFL
jgi:hypothetical protein